MRVAGHIRPRYSITRPVGRVRIETARFRNSGEPKTGITRPVGRVRIETPWWCSGHNGTASITRPVGRVRIETNIRKIVDSSDYASPGRLAGCGLKRYGYAR